MLRFAIYISDHGFGHATRMAALAEEFIRFGIIVYIRSGRPDHLFRNLDDRFFQKENAICDVGVRHGKNLAPDIAATKSALFDLAHQRTDIVDREVAFLRWKKIDLIISDIPWLVVEAGGYAGIPVFAISNFDWLFIYKDLFANDTSLRPLLNTIYGLYQRVDLAFRLPMSSKASMNAFRKIEKVGLLCRSPKNKGCSLNVLGLPDLHPVLLCSFGGAGHMDTNLEAICKAFPGTVLSVNDCMATNHVRIDSDADYSEIVACSDVFLTKPGYSSFAEAVNNGKYLLYHPRHQYPEEDVLIKGISGYPHKQQIDNLEMSVSSWKKLFSSIPISSKSNKKIHNTNVKIASLIVQRFVEMKYGAKKLNSVFDTGSNNISYSLAIDGDPVPIHTTQLSTGLGKSFHHSPDGMIDVPAQSLVRYRNSAGYLLSVDSKLCSRKVVIATGIHRKASFAVDIQEWYMRKWNVPYRVISEKEEAECAYYVAKRMIPNGKSALIVDVGGFSTQFVSSDPDGKRNYSSLPLGLLLLQQRIVEGESLGSILTESLKYTRIDTPDMIIAIGLTAAYLSYAIQDDKLFAIDEIDKSVVSSKCLNQIINSEDDILELDSSIRYMEPQNSAILRISANFYKILLDRFALKEINVCAYGISLGYHIEHKNKAITKRIR